MTPYGFWVTQDEIRQRRSAALAELSQWFDMMPGDLRTVDTDGQVRVIARVSGAKAQQTARRLLQEHFPGSPVSFES